MQGGLNGPDMLADWLDRERKAEQQPVFEQSRAGIAESGGLKQIGYEELLTKRPEITADLSSRLTWTPSTRPAPASA